MRRVITRMIEDVINTATHNIEASALRSADEVRLAGKTLICFSEGMARNERAIKSFLFEHMYRTEQIMLARDNAESIVCDLFDKYFHNLAEMSDDWASGAVAQGDDEIARARQVCDYVAGMTDRFAVQEHRRLFDVTPDLR